MRKPLSRALPAALAVLAAVAALPVSAATASAREPVPYADGRTSPVDHPTYIVTVRKDLDPAVVAGLLGVTPVHVFRSTLHGFAARLTPGQLAALRALPAVESVEQDGTASTGAF